LPTARLMSMEPKKTSTFFKKINFFPALLTYITTDNFIAKIISRNKKKLKRKEILTKLPKKTTREEKISLFGKLQVFINHKYTKIKDRFTNTKNFFKNLFKRKNNTKRPTAKDLTTFKKNVSKNFSKMANQKVNQFKSALDKLTQDNNKLNQEIRRLELANINLDKLRQKAEKKPLTNEFSTQTDERSSQANISSDNIPDIIVNLVDTSTRKNKSPITPKFGSRLPFKKNKDTQ